MDLRHGEKLDHRNRLLSDEFFLGNLWLVCGLLFAAALCARLTLIWALAWDPADLDLTEMGQLARSLAEKGTLADPYVLPTGPSAHHAPLYPFLLSLIYRSLGYGGIAAWAATIMNFVFASAQYALLPILAREIGLKVSVGVLAAVAGVIPATALIEGRFDGAMNGLVLIVCAIVAANWLRNTGPGRARRSLITGVFFGLALIAEPTELTVLLAFAALTGFSRRRSGLPDRRPWLLGSTLTMLIGAGCGVSPWIVRNYLQFGEFVFVRSNFPMEFSLSNHDGAYPLFVDNYLIGYPDNWYVRRYPYTNADEAILVRRLGEIGYNRARMKEALDWCFGHRWAFLRLTLQRFALFWTFGGVQLFKSILMATLSLTALCGAVLMGRQQRGLSPALSAVLIGFPLPYYFVQFDTRYRYPILWCLYLFSACFLCAAWVHYHPQRAIPDAESGPVSGKESNLAQELSGAQ